MGTRFYDFITGYDTDSQPSGSTPTGLADLATLEYGVDNYAIYIDSVANAKAIAATFRADGKPLYVKALLAWFYFDSASSATGDDENVIMPTAGTGRWLRIPIKGFGSVQDVATSATIAAMASSTPVVRLTGSTTTELQGVTAGVKEQILALYNASSAVITIKHESASASAANRLSLQQSRDVTLQAGGALLLRYDATLTRWVPAAGSGAGGGGMGSAKLRLVADTNAPLAVQENLISTFQYTNGGAQVLYGVFKVPAAYVSGTALSCRFQWYSAGTSGNILLQTVATLIRQATDAITATTNQRTSTNAAVTVSAGTVNEPQTVNCDLTSTIGQINAVNVSAGDLILIALSRGTDTCADVASLIEDSAEVSEA